MTYRVAVALGSNLGERLEIMRRAVAKLRELGEVEAISSLYETEPVDGPEQNPYLNAVCVLTTGLEPARLLEELHRLEAEEGRVRRERWGPRFLDLDLISATDPEGGKMRIETEQLVLPHPRAHLRRFVLEPLAEVWPEALVGDATSAGERLDAVGDQAVERLGGDWVASGLVTARALLAAQAAVFVGYGVLVAATGSRPLRSSPATTVGAVLVLTGSGLVTWAVTTLGPALSPYPEPRPGTELVAEGPYRFMRHPIYSGLVMCLVGLASAVRSWPGLAASLVVGGFFWFKAGYEESRLRLGVPGYLAYQRRVRRRMIPGSRASTLKSGIVLR